MEGQHGQHDAEREHREQPAGRLKLRPYDVNVERQNDPMPEVERITDLSHIGERMPAEDPVDEAAARHDQQARSRHGQDTLKAREPRLHVDNRDRRPHQSESDDGQQDKKNGER